MKSWDAIIVGGGIIGLTLSIELRKQGLKVLIVERGEPGREASHAAAGMLSDHLEDTPAAMQAIATASARMYPEFVHELQDESGIKVDLRDYGALVLGSPGESGDKLPAPLSELEPALADPTRSARFLKERSVDPRALVAAALKAAKHRLVDISSGTEVTGLLVSDGKVAGVSTHKSEYRASVVVNCAGAWAGQVSPQRFPTRPVKGQMLCVVGQRVLRHVIRALEVYLVPRSDGRTLIGATVEEAGYDKRTDPDTIHRMHQAAIALIPALGQARVHEAWAGLRPGTPDALPMLGATNTPGYFVAAGHYRDGILLAPITARVMAQAITGMKPEQDLAAFSPARFTEK